MSDEVHRTITFKLANSNLAIDDRKAVFFMPWRGLQDCYWIVPLTYIESLKPIGEWHTRVKIRQAFFTTPIGGKGWQADWRRHLSQ